MLSKNKTIRKIALFVLAASMSFAVCAQPYNQGSLLQLPAPHRTYIPPKTLTLKDAIFLALRNNVSVRSAELQRVVDKFSLEVARNQFELQYSLTGSGTLARGARPSYTTSSGVTLNTATGGNVGATLNNTFTPGSHETSLALTATQPLLRGANPQVALADLHNAEDAERIARLTLKNTLISTITSVVSQYYSLVQAYNNLTVNKLSLEDSQRTLSQTEAKIKAGQAAETDIVQQQAQVENQKVAVTQASNDIAQQYRNLLILLGLDPHAKLVVDKTIDISSLKIPSREESIQEALLNNISYQQALINMIGTKRNLLVAKDNQKWQLNLTASATKELSASGGVDNSNNGSIVLNLSIPVHDLSRQSGLVSARIALQQAKIQLNNQKQQLITDVANALTNLHATKKQIKIAEEGVKLDQRSLEIAQKKLQFGRTTLFEVTTLRENLTRDAINLISQKISYINSFAVLDATLGTSLQTWGVHVRY